MLWRGIQSRNEKGLSKELCMICKYRGAVNKAQAGKERKAHEPIEEWQEAEDGHDSPLDANRIFLIDILSDIATSFAG